MYLSIYFKNNDDKKRSYNNWGVCSRHCTEDTAASPKMMEARLDIIGQEKCADLGTSSNVKPNIEICASVKNKEFVPYMVFDQSNGNFRMVERDQEKLEFYGGADACQGDSGGPL